MIFALSLYFQKASEILLWIFFLQVLLCFSLALGHETEDLHRLPLIRGDHTKEGFLVCFCLCPFNFPQKTS